MTDFPVTLRPCRSNSPSATFPASFLRVDLFACPSTGSSVGTVGPFLDFSLLLPLLVLGKEVLLSLAKT
jgi:hypothetical protein